MPGCFVTRRVSALVLVVAAIPAGAQARPQPPARLTEALGYVQALSEFQAAAEKCKWVDGVGLKALGSMSMEFQTEIEALSPTGGDQNAQALVAGSMRAGSRACGDNAFRAQVQAMADQAVAVLVTRAKSLLGAEDAAPFAKGETSLDPRRSVVEQMNGVVQTQLGANYARLKAAQDTVAASALRIACPGRKMIRSSTPRACPQLSAEDEKRAKYAEAVLQGVENVVEGFAARLATNAPPGAPGPAASAPVPTASLMTNGKPESLLKVMEGPQADLTNVASCTAGADGMFVRLDDPEALRIEGQYSIMYYAPYFMGRAPANRQWFFIAFDKAADAEPVLIKAYNISGKDTVGTGALVRTIRQSIGKPGDVYAAAQKSYTSNLELRYSAAKIDYEPFWLRRCAVKK